MSLRTERLRSDQTVISLARLQELHRKEANHDGYVMASIAMGVRQRHRQELAKHTRANGLHTESAYHLGWLDCLNEYNTTMLDMIARQMDLHPHADVKVPRRVLKGQRCLINEPGCACLVAIR